MYMQFNLFCKHKNSEIICWHRVHPLYGKYPTVIEYQTKCNECNKYFIRWFPLNVKWIQSFIDTYKDKEWSDTCNPVL